MRMRRDEEKGWGRGGGGGGGEGGSLAPLDALELIFMNFSSVSVGWEWQRSCRWAPLLEETHTVSPSSPSSSSLPPYPSSLLKCCSDGCPAWCCFNIKYKNVLFGQRAHKAPAETDLMQTRVHQRSQHLGLEGPGAELRGPGPSWQGKIFCTLLGEA